MRLKAKVRLNRELPESNMFKKVFALTFIVTVVTSTLLSFPLNILPTSAAPTYSLYIFPTRIQEGFDTNITLSLSGVDANKTYAFQVNVTSPADAFFLLNLTVATNAAGQGSNRTNFWSDFSSPANTNHIGTYNVAVNQTLATSSFTVGLTDKTTYLESETVDIRAAGYMSNESVIADLKFANASLFSFPRSPDATPEGLVSLTWPVSEDAALGLYVIEVVASNTVNGTMKTPPDTQTFTVEGVCELQTKNLAGQALANVTVEVYNATTDSYLNLVQDTNSTGWARFVLGAGNYTFKAFWKDVEVGSLKRTVAGNLALSLEVRLSHLKLIVKDEAGAPLPRVDLEIYYKYKTRVPTTIPESRLFTTGVDGTVILENVFTNIDYVVSSSRYDFVFNETTIQSLPARGWNNITIVAPTYTMLVKILDSKNNPAVGLQSSVYEWSSGVSKALESKLTDSQGNASFALTVGRYRLRFFKASVFLNEVTVDLTQDQLSVVVKSDICNIDLHVIIVDYFGQPMPNVSVEFQRKVDSNYQIVATQTTGADGTARFDGVVGGDSLLQVSLADKLIMSQSLCLDESSEQVVFKLGTYVSILGVIIDAGVFVTIILVLIVVIAFILLSIRRKLPHLRFQQKKMNVN